MPIKRHSNFDAIKQAIQKLSKKGRAFSAVCYRCTEPQFANQIVSGLGSQLHGARWTPKNSFPTVYLCETTDDEVAAVVNPFLATDKIHWRAIQDRREAVSQAIGRAIQEVCFSGLIAPSQASPGSRNIIIFPKKLKAPEMLSASSLKPLD